jgi:hypothetical protein
MKGTKMNISKLLGRGIEAIAFYAACFVLCSVASPVEAWYASIHDAMTRTMIEGLSPNIRNNINVNAVLFGANEPDGTMYDPDKARLSRTYGFDKLEENWDSAAAKTGISKSDLMNWRSPKCYHGNLDCIKQIKAQLVNELASPSKNWNRVSVLLGQLSHHLQDLHQPYHAAEILGRPVKPGAHEEFEKRTGDICTAEQIRLTRSQSGGVNRDLNSIAVRAASMVGQETLSSDKETLRQYFEWAIANSEAYVNQALSDGFSKEQAERPRREAEKIGDLIRKLRDESRDKINDLTEKLRNQGRDAIEQHRRNHPELYRPPDSPQTGPPAHADAEDCPFKWTHPLCNWTYCCPYNNGWDKDCLRAGKCWPGVEGCMRGFGCRRID